MLPRWRIGATILCKPCEPEGFLAFDPARSSTPGVAGKSDAANREKRGLDGVAGETPALLKQEMAISEWRRRLAGVFF